MVLFGELADGLGLVSVGLSQLDLVALQLALQLLDVGLQLGHAALPFPLSTLQTSSQLVLLLLQVLHVNEGREGQTFISLGTDLLCWLSSSSEIIEGGTKSETSQKKLCCVEDRKGWQLDPLNKTYCTTIKAQLSFYSRAKIAFLDFFLPPMQNSGFKFRCQ